MSADTHKQFKQDSEKAIETLQKELGRIRTGRASPSLLENVKVNYYGASTPLTQVANIAAEARLLTVAPWEKTMLGEIEKSIQASGLGLTPSNDGKIIRVPIPALTGERRKELQKQVKKVGEEYKVAVRNHRRIANDKLKKSKDAKEMTEDEFERATKKIQDETDQMIKKLDTLVADKEKEIMEF